MTLTDLLTALEVQRILARGEDPVQLLLTPAEAAVLEPGHLDAATPLVVRERVVTVEDGALVLAFTLPLWQPGPAPNHPADWFNRPLGDAVEQARRAFPELTITLDADATTWTEDEETWTEWGAFLVTGRVRLPDPSVLSAADRGRALERWLLQAAGLPSALQAELDAEMVARHARKRADYRHPAELVGVPLPDELVAALRRRSPEEDADPVPIPLPVTAAGLVTRRDLGYRRLVRHDFRLLRPWQDRLEVHIVVPVWADTLAPGDTVPAVMARLGQAAAEAAEEERFDLVRWTPLFTPRFEGDAYFHAVLRVDLARVVLAVAYAKAVERWLAAVVGLPDDCQEELDALLARQEAPEGGG